MSYIPYKNNPLIHFGIYSTQYYTHIHIGTVIYRNVSKKKSNILKKSIIHERE